MSASPLG